MDGAVKDLTELVDIDPLRVDLVKNPANGFPVLLMKALSPESKTDEKPDTSGANEAEKEAEVPENTPETPEAPEPQAEPVVEKSAAELVDEAVAKAVQPFQEVIKGLEEQMAVLKSTPIPGGPVVTVPAAQRSSSERAHAAAEAARFRGLAKSVTDQDLVRFYEKKAAEAEQAANA